MYEMDNYFQKCSTLLLSVLAFILVSSAIAKLITITGTVENIYKLVLVSPVRFVDRTYLRLTIQTLSVLEIVLGIALFISKRIKIYALYGIFLFLLLMLLVGGYQWARGFESCGCFGQLLKISPAMTTFKNFALILITMALIKISKPD